VGWRCIAGTFLPVIGIATPVDIFCPVMFSR